MLNCSALCKYDKGNIKEILINMPTYLLSFGAAQAGFMSLATVTLNTSLVAGV